MCVAAASEPPGAVSPTVHACEQPHWYQQSAPPSRLGQPPPATNVSAYPPLSTARPCASSWQEVVLHCGSLAPWASESIAQLTDVQPSRSDPARAPSLDMNMRRSRTRHVLEPQSSLHGAVLRGEAHNRVSCTRLCPHVLCMKVVAARLAASLQNLYLKTGQNSDSASPLVTSCLIRSG